MGRKGRGRLSSIDLLPEDAEADVIWAVGQLQKRERLQKDILEEFNGRLADRGIGSVSASAFNRYAVRKAKAFARLDEVRQISSALTNALGPDSADDLTITVAETIKTLVFEILESDGDISTKGAMELSRALKHAVEAQTISSDRRKKVEADFAKKATNAIEKAGKSKGLTAKTRDAIKREILGIQTGAT